MIRFEHVTYTYPEAAQPVLQDIDLHLPEAALTLLVGPSGAGKSTLLRCTNGLVPHFSGGWLRGSISVDGWNPVTATPQTMSRHVGFVFQDPEAQFVMNQVEDEIAFALENAAMPAQEMRLRVEEVLDMLDLAPLRERRLDTLSGGERQRVAIAAALAFRPRVLVLDEPTSQLDPQSAEDVLQALVRLNTDLGLTVLLAEHRLERVLPFVDRLVYLPGDGSGPLAGSPREVLPQLELVPPLIALGKAMDWQPLPLTIKEGMKFSLRSKGGAPTQERLARRPGVGEPLVQARDVSVAYHGQPAVRGVDVDMWPGEIVVLMGRNGSGKTTLLKSLVGLERPQAGRVRVAGQDIARLDVADVCRTVGYLPQDPNALLFAESVAEELMITLRNHRLVDRQGKTLSDLPLNPQALLKRLGLAGMAHRYPRDLSVGERQRVALGAVTVTRPRALLLDEPTRGLDYAAKRGLAHLLREWRDEGMAILLVTHDVEFAAGIADHILLMSQGEIIASGDPAEVMGTSPLFAPQVARLFPGSGWLTVEDALPHLT
jgi:energy-coupling factor transporter ATP-binding protein EcfA2